MRALLARPMRAQRGVALLAVLVVMLVALALSVASVRASALAGQMAALAQQRELALTLGEAALLDAQRDIDGGIDPASARAQALAQGLQAAFAQPCVAGGAFQGLCQASSASAGAALELAAGTSAAVPFGRFTGAQLAAPASTPVYLIELLSTAQQGTLYRITSRAQGSSAATGVALQALYHKPQGAPGRRVGWRELGNWPQLQAAGSPAAGQP